MHIACYNLKKRLSKCSVFYLIKMDGEVNKNGLLKSYLIELKRSHGNHESETKCYQLHFS